jgi:hypothetical protein
MDGAASLLVYALSSLLAVAMISGGALWAWRGWIDLRRTQLLSGQTGGGTDVQALRARVKRLETIASGLDL